MHANQLQRHSDIQSLDMSSDRNICSSSLQSGTGQTSLQAPSSCGRWEERVFLLTAATSFRHHHNNAEAPTQTMILQRIISRFLVFRQTVGPRHKSRRDQKKRRLKSKQGVQRIDRPYLSTPDTMLSVNRLKRKRVTFTGLTIVVASSDCSSTMACSSDDVSILSGCSVSSSNNDSFGRQSQGSAQQVSPQPFSPFVKKTGD